MGDDSTQSPEDGDDSAAGNAAVARMPRRHQEADAAIAAFVKKIAGTAKAAN